MSIKDDLLRKLSVSRLKLLAEQNKVSLIRVNHYSFANEKYALTKKEDIIEALLDSKKISEKKIRELMEPKKKGVRKSIPKSVKMSVWDKYIGALKGEGKCFVCGERSISQMNFDCGHVKAVANGGDDSVSNLRPVCRPCNSSMGDMNLEEFKKEYHSTQTKVKAKKTVTRRRPKEEIIASWINVEADA